MIREIQKADLDQGYFDLLCQLSGELKTVTSDIIIDCWERYSRNPCHQIFVYEHVERVIGVAGVLIEHKMLHYKSTVGHIEDVVVDKTSRLSGVGKALIRECVTYCKAAGCYKVILDCSQDNVSFYEACGFHIDGNCMRIGL